MTGARHPRSSSPWMPVKRPRCAGDVRPDEPDVQEPDQPPALSDLPQSPPGCRHTHPRTGAVAVREEGPRGAGGGPAAGDLTEMLDFTVR